MTTTRRALGSAVATVALALGVAAAVAAPAQAADEFGQHVRTCTQNMGGFDGQMNPGMHQGYSGWATPSANTC